MTFKYFNEIDIVFKSQRRHAMWVSYGFNCKNDKLQGLNKNLGTAGFKDHSLHFIIKV